VNASQAGQHDNQRIEFGFHGISFGLGMKRDEEHSPFPSEVLLCRLIGFEAFTALLICSQFQNPVNPPILRFDWLILGGSV
jgi:hypothetical protein